MTNSIRRIASALLLSSGLLAAVSITAQPVQAQEKQPQAQEYYGRILSTGVIGSGNSWIASVDHPSTGVYIVNFKLDNGPGRAPNCVCTGENVEGGAPITVTVEKTPLNSSQQTNLVRVRTTTVVLGLNVNVDAPFRIQCSPEQAATFQAAHFDVLADGTCNILSGDDWVSSCVLFRVSSPLGGAFRVTFKRPFSVSPFPSCLAMTTPTPGAPSPPNFAVNMPPNFPGPGASSNLFAPTIETQEFANFVNVFITNKIVDDEGETRRVPANRRFKILCYGSQP